MVSVCLCAGGCVCVRLCVCVCVLLSVFLGIVCVSSDEAFVEGPDVCCRGPDVLR